VGVGTVVESYYVNLRWNRPGASRIRGHDGQLWYETECGFRFPVPIAEAGTATFLAEDRAILFMRYIRKYMAVMEDSKH